MERELKLHMDFYLTMKERETQDEAEERFHSMMNNLSKLEEDQESAFQVYETEVQEV